MADARPAEQFASLDQQRDVAHAGMWVFLASETLFFGGLLAAYTVYRIWYPEGFAAASTKTDVVLGTINTAVLLTSSALMGAGVRVAEARGSGRAVGLLLLGTALLGLAFLGVKGTEYVKDAHDHLVPGYDFEFDERLRRGAELFFLLYFIMTGIHAVHLTVGILLVGAFAVRAWRGAFADRLEPVAIAGLYWHFVDLVWVFLYPLLYLNGRAG